MTCLFSLSVFLFYLWHSCPEPAPREERYSQRCVWLPSSGLPCLSLAQGISGSMNDQDICNQVTTLLNEKKFLNDPAYAASE